MEALERVAQLGVVPVVKIEDARHGPQLAEALISGGLPCAEITFRTAAAGEAIRLMSEACPEMLIGAGTVLSVEQARKAVESGACFVVSPGFDPKVVDWCLQHEVAVVPGVATPTEALMALDKGLHVLKFFPCEALGGIRTLEAMAAALIGMQFIPTGGITASNMADYLRLPMVYAVAGSWLATSKLLSAGKFAEIAGLAGEAAGIVRGVRGSGASA